MFIEFKDPPKIVLLNGPSSAGKSTLAHELQMRLEEAIFANYSIVSIDDFMRLATDEKIYEDDVFDISGDMCKQVIADLKKYDGVIIDHVITSERIFEDLKKRLGKYSILLVQVTAPLSDLKERELARKNRCVGSAEASYENLFPRHGYDISVDTHYSTPKMASLRIIYEKMV